MMMYRRVHDVQERMRDLAAHLRAAILADNTREMAAQGTDAQGVIDQVLNTLRNTLDEGVPTFQDAASEVKVERRFVQAAANSLTLAWNRAEAIASATDVPTMRATLLDCKTHADFAAAYVDAALGEQME